MKYVRLYKAAAVVLVLAITLNVIIVAVSPPKVSSYAQYLPNGKVLVDKEFLENVQSHYPPVVRWLLWTIGTGRFTEWLMPLDEQSIFEAARYRAGFPKDSPFWVDELAGERVSGPADQLSSYEGTYWVRFLRHYLKALKTEGLPYLSAFGRFVVRDTLIECLVNQLKIVDFVKKHPDVLEEKIDRPIVIAGPPRTMTTHAQGILMSHPDTFYLRFLESRDPLAPTGLDDSLVYTEQDPRAKMFHIAIIVFRYMRPFFTFMFRLEPNEPWNTPQEDIMLTQIVFGSPALETQTFVPSYAKAWHSTENTSAFRFQKLCHRVMQYNHRRRLGYKPKDPAFNKRWIMKTPEYAGFLRDTLKVYPDALIVLTHRDPLPVVESFIPMVIYVGGFWNWYIDAEKFAEYETNSLELRLRHLVEQIDIVPKNQVIHIPFRDFVKDNFASIEQICKFANLSLSDQAVTSMKNYIQNSPREGANRFEYRIGTFGPNFTKDKIRARFTDYSAKFKEYIA